VGNILGSNLFNSLTGGAIVGLAGRGRPARIGYPVLAAMVAVMLLTWLCSTAATGSAGSRPPCSSSPTCSPSPDHQLNTPPNPSKRARP